MKYKHLIISALLCLSTMVLFLIFWSQLPKNIPLQITLTGEAGTALPKSVVVFGMPLIFTAFSIFSNVQKVQREEEKILSYYYVPIIALILTIVTLFFALVLFA